MNDVDDVIDQLRGASHRAVAPPPGDLDVVLRRGRRRRAMRRAGTVTAAGAVAAVVVAAMVGQLPSTRSPELLAPRVEERAPSDGDAARPSHIDREPTLDRAPARGDDDAGTCSAAGMDPSSSEQELPPAVAETRERIVDAAAACDYDRLAALTGVTAQFLHSFGGGDDPVASWRQREEAGEPVLADLVTLLDLEHGVTDPGDVPGEVYVWPEVFAIDDPTRGDFQPVVEAGLYTQDDVDRWLEITGAYSGHRVGIDAAGTWRFFVAGE